MDDSEKKYLAEINGLVNAVVEKINIRAKDVDSKLCNANEKEFEVSKYLITWSLASIGFYGGLLNYFSGDTNLINVLFFLPLTILLFSLMFGVLHYMDYRRLCLKIATEMDNKNSSFITRLYESKDKIKELNIIIEEFKEDEKKPRIVKGNLIYLRLQFYLFIVSLFFIMFLLIYKSLI